MDEIRLWPEAMIAHLADTLGEILHVERMHGLSSNAVWLACFETKKVVVKETNPVEAGFYKEVAPQLDKKRLFAPELFAAIPAGAATWLAVEYVPEPLPKQRWLADDGVVAHLRYLHGADLQNVPGPIFEPLWSAEMTRNALHVLQPASPDVEARLQELHARSQALFRPICWISGDPNPTNWGIRDDGSLVLFDWERFGRGHPALDLAITVPGLGRIEDFEKTIQIYQQGAAAERVHPVRVDDLICAKAWSVVEFLDHARAGKVASAESVRSVKQHFSRWLSDIAAFA